MRQDMQPPRDQDFGAGRARLVEILGLIETPRDIDKTHSEATWGQ
jgi:hypothetical protein